MKGQLIKNYINKLSIQDINSLALKNNINLNENELKYIYNLIKNDYNNLLYEDSTHTLEKLKNNISNNNYTKIIELFNTYKQKYQSLL